MTGQTGAPKLSDTGKHANSKQNRYDKLISGRSLTALFPLEKMFY